MVLTNSVQIYELACQKAKESTQNLQFYNQQEQLQDAKTSQGALLELKRHYVELISTMMFELITKKHCDLLSILCTLNDIRVDVDNYEIFSISSDFKSTYDILPILDGLNIAFESGLNQCVSSFLNAKGHIFQRKAFAEEFDYISFLNNELRRLDGNLERVLSFCSYNKVEPKLQEAILTIDTKTSMPDPKLTDKLNQLAEKRRANDTEFAEQIQNIQILLQSELKQIMSIRDGIDYYNMQEPVLQLMTLFYLISDTLLYHSHEDDSKKSYHNLIESCEDFLEHIMQSLAMLGVTIINDVDKPFDPARHKTIRGVQPIRQAHISKVTKIGFSYKDKVLEKAEVELDQSRRIFTLE
jgi:molecular chaperone GrpE (heat shock protein)